MNFFSYIKEKKIHFFKIYLVSLLLWKKNSKILKNKSFYLRKKIHLFRIFFSQQIFLSRNSILSKKKFKIIKKKSKFIIFEKKTSDFRAVAFFFIFFEFFFRILFLFILKFLILSRCGLVADSYITIEVTSQ